MSDCKNASKQQNWAGVSGEQNLFRWPQKICFSILYFLFFYVFPLPFKWKYTWKYKRHKKYSGIFVCTPIA